MRTKGFDVQLSSHVKDDISGMRIILEKDNNHNAKRQYKSGYTLSQMKMPEIKLFK